MRRLLFTIIILMVPTFWIGYASAANDTAGNPRAIDTFGSDVAISAGPIAVTSIVVEGASAGDTATFIDAAGREVLRLSNTVNAGSIVWSPAEPFTFGTGLTFDDSASDLASGDFIFIYLK